MGKGYCGGDGYQWPVIKEGRYYCPVCGQRMKSTPRQRRRVLEVVIDSRPRKLAA
jgi:uncharacterized Zn finger protein (UPF0148 family)